LARQQAVRHDMQTLLVFYIGAGLLLALLSIPLIQRRIPPNGLYGFRVPKTMDNPGIWYDANAYAGKWLLLTGIATTAGAMLFYRPQAMTLDAYASACAALALGLLAVSVLQSFRYLNTLTR
jgi:uncharacterized membrane protein